MRRESQLIKMISNKRFNELKEKPHREWVNEYYLRDEALIQKYENLSLKRQLRGSS